MFYVFAYGSLIFSPEHPELLVSGTIAVLDGHRRAFNKRSGPRACRRMERGYPELEARVPEAFREPHSLALGTEPGGHMAGVLQAYPIHAQPRVLASLDAREGVWRDRAPDTWSYLPTRVRVSCRDGRTVEALTYLSNPSGSWHAGGLDAVNIARILLHATPTTRGPRALGAEYLLETVAALRALGIADPHLEDLAGHLPLQVPQIAPKRIAYIS